MSKPISERAYELRSWGRTFKWIGKELGVSEGSAEELFFSYVNSLEGEEFREAIIFSLDNKSRFLLRFLAEDLGVDEKDLYMSRYSIVDGIDTIRRDGFGKVTVGKVASFIGLDPDEQINHEYIKKCIEYLERLGYTISK